MNEDCFQLGMKALIQRADGKVLLLKKNKKSDLDLWDLPGGRIQRGEEVVDALRREVLEETGLHELGEIKPLMMVLTSIRIPVGDPDVGLIFSVYLCPLTQNDVNIQLSSEHSSYVWVMPEEAEEMLRINHPAALTQAIGKLEKVTINSY